jgi:SOS-response transcriptional repressor LexA
LDGGFNFTFIRSFMQTTFHERLAAALAARGVKASHLAKLVGVSAQSVTFWLRGDTTPKRKYVEKICSVLRIDWQWLEKGIGMMDADTRGFAHENPLESQPEATGDFSPFDRTSQRKLPLVELEDLVLYEGVLSVAETTLVKRFVESMFPTGERSFAITIRNSAMSPIVEVGDVVVVDPDVKLSPGDLIAIRLRQKNENIYRKYAQGTNGEVILSPANPDWETLRFTADEWREGVEILGVTTWTAKQSRRS